MMSCVVAPQCVQPSRFAGGPRQSSDQADHGIADIARAGGEFLGDEVIDACGAR